MYIPKKFIEEDIKVIVPFLKKHPLAIIVSTEKSGKLIASHIPLTINVLGNKVNLKGHLAKDNSQASIPKQGYNCLVIFSEPHSYISPINYNAELSVPTWNYIAVHCYGRIFEIEDREDRFKQIEELILAFEPEYLEKWDAMPSKYRENMYNGIVPFSIDVFEIQGQRKLSQNKSTEEQLRIADLLMKSSNSGEREIGNEMFRNCKGD